MLYIVHDEYANSFDIPEYPQLAESKISSEATISKMFAIDWQQSVLRDPVCVQPHVLIAGGGGAWGKGFTWRIS